MTSRMLNGVFVVGDAAVDQQWTRGNTFKEDVVARLLGGQCHRCVEGTLTATSDDVSTSTFCRLVAATTDDGRTRPYIAEWHASHRERSRRGRCFMSRFLAV